MKNREGSFLPYKKQGNNDREAVDSLDGMGTSIDLNVITGDQQLQKKKRRRCWSPELHKRFVDALHQLGGEQGMDDYHLFKNCLFCPFLIPCFLWGSFIVLFEVGCVFGGNDEFWNIWA